jgi:hypothetical protein
MSLRNKCTVTDYVDDETQAITEMIAFTLRSKITPRN